METRSLEQQREEFSQRKFPDIPLAGMIAWTAIAGMILSARLAVWVIFVSSGSIVYLGMFLGDFSFLYRF